MIVSLVPIQMATNAMRRARPDPSRKDEIVNTKRLSSFIAVETNS
jgi:hypothetical protein